VRIESLLVISLLALATTTAARADGDPKAEARTHYERGLDLASSGAYQAAQAEFREAYAKSPHFAVLYNLGLCEVALGHPLEAVEALSKYLGEGAEQVPPARRTQVEAQIAELEARIAELSVTSDRPGARVTVDGRDVGRTPLIAPVRLNAGTHEVSAALEGTSTVSRTVEVREAERRTIDFTLTAPLVAAPATAPAEASGPPHLFGLDPPQKREEPKPSGTLRTVGYVLTGVGVVVGGGGVGHYIWNAGRKSDWQSEHDALKNGYKTPDYYDRAVANNEQAASIEGAGKVTAGLFIASGVLVAGGVTLIVTNPGSGATVAYGGTW
jgi:tetratricopeptide (TPR) repeat protein